MPLTDFFIEAHKRQFCAAKPEFFFSSNDQLQYVNSSSLSSYCSLIINFIWYLILGVTVKSIQMSLHHARMVMIFSD
jgi:hypothetical protein